MNGPRTNRKSPCDQKKGSAMRFGVCVSTVEEIEIIAHAGFDFCELPARAVLPFDQEAAVLPTLRALGSAPLPAESFNVLIPGELPLCGPRADHAALQTYVQRAFQRMAQLGGRIAVLGSGAARRVPDGFSRDIALDQLAESIALIADRAARHGIELALEHLNRGESNVFNSVAESQAFLVERGLVQARLLVDLHHMELEQESFADILTAAPLLAHVHVADGGRNAPGTGGYNYAGFMDAIHQTGYNRRISAECRWDDLAAQAAGALAFMRAAWKV